MEWDVLVTLVTCIWGKFLFKVILRSFGALVSKWPATLKRMAVEQSGVKFGVKSVSFGGHLVHLSQNACNSKTESCTVKTERKLGLDGICYMYMGYL